LATFTHLFHEEIDLEQVDRIPYETPEIVETFEAAEVLGAAEGSVGTGSRVSYWPS
jgi:hypothetical protein